MTVPPGALVGAALGLLAGLIVMLVAHPIRTRAALLLVGSMVAGWLIALAIVTLIHR